MVGEKVMGRTAGDSIEEALAENAANEVGTVEVGWVIEHADSDASAPKYFCGVWGAIYSGGWWDGDHDGAVRFCRRQDAVRTAQALFGIDHDHRICEHQWG